MSRPEFIPAKISHDEYVEAIGPLLGLLGVTPMEVYDEIHIHRGRISFKLVACVEGDDSDFPQALAVGQFTEGDAREFAEFAVPVTVEVVD